MTACPELRIQFTNRALVECAEIKGLEISAIREEIAIELANQLNLVGENTDDRSQKNIENKLIAEWLQHHFDMRLLEEECLAKLPNWALNARELLDHTLSSITVEGITYFFDGQRLTHLVRKISPIKGNKKKRSNKGYQHM